MGRSCQVLAIGQATTSGYNPSPGTIEELVHIKPHIPDEAIHLASGMLMAGYPSVIATMWFVDDKDAPFVADQVYAQLIKDGNIGNGEAGGALHNAVAGLREKMGEQQFGRWVPYIYI